MTGDNTFDVKTRLANAVRQYLEQTPGERISEDDNLRPVCRRIAALLSEALRAADGWSRYNEVDDIIPCTVEKVSETELNLSGLVIWLSNGGTTQEWIDPISTSIRLSDRSPQAIRYELRFGNADRGLGKCPYGSSQDFPHVPVTDWMFTFSSEPDALKA
jgi:hypothetical protein